MLKYEDLIEEIRHRPLGERLSLLEIIARSIKQDVNTESDSQVEPGAKFLKVGEFDPDGQPDLEEVEHNKSWLVSSQKLAEVTQH